MNAQAQQRYTGLVRANILCNVAGQLYPPGSVFAVTDTPLWSDDPYSPVEVTGYTHERGEEPEPIYVVTDAPIGAAADRVLSDFEAQR